MNRRSSIRGFSLPYVLLLLSFFMALLFTTFYTYWNEYETFQAKREYYELYLMKEYAIDYVITQIESGNHTKSELIPFKDGYIGLYYIDGLTEWVVHIDLYGENSDAWFTLTYNTQTKTYIIE